MRKTYFIFKDMKEATYYFRNIAYELRESNKKIKVLQNEKKIIIPKVEIEKENFIKKLFSKLRKNDKIVLEDNIEINFKSVKSNFIISENAFYFLEDEYETKYFIKIINKL